MFVGCWLFVVSCSLFGDGWLWFVVCWLLFVVCRVSLLFEMHDLVFAVVVVSVGCVLCVDCCR